MRLGKIAWTILIAGIFIIAFVALYMIYAREQRAQEPLEHALSVAQDALPKLTTERTNLDNTLTDLEDRVDRAMLQLKTARASFPTTRTESIEVDERLFDIAVDWGLNVTELTATEPGDENAPVEVEIEDAEGKTEDIDVEDIGFTVTTFKVAVEGAVVDILDFIHSVATHEDFTAATIEEITLEVPEPLTDEEKEDLTDAEIEEAEMPSTTLTLTTYNYQGE